MTLTPEQLNQFKRDGFIVLKNFANLDEVAAIKEKALTLMQRPSEPLESEEEYHDLNADGSYTLRRLRQVYDRDPLFAAWMTNADIRPILKQVLGETPVLTLAHHNSIMTKMPSEISNTCWHQDRRYWDFESDNLVSVWLALGSERIENGLLEFIPGTHTMEFMASQFDSKVCFRNDISENEPIIAERVHQDLEAGDVVVFHCRVLHSAFNNKTNTPKVSFVYTVKGQSNRPIPGTRSSRHPEVVLEAL